MLTELNHGRSSPKRVEAYRMTSFVHLILVAIVVTILGVAEAPNASAHAFLLRSAPADGSTLAHAPSSMTLTFDEDVLLQAGSLTLRSANGSVLLRTGLPGGSSAISGKAGPELVVGLPDLGKGTYSATWSVRSADDLHQTTGTVSFAVGQISMSRPVDRRGQPPPVLSSVLRWLDLTGVAVLLGALLLMFTVIPRSRTSSVDAAAMQTIIWRVFTVVAGLELVLGIAVLIDSAGVTNVLGALTSARLGRLWLIREASFAAATVVSFRAIHRRGSARPYTITTMALTLGSIGAIAGSSHVGIGADRPLALLLLLVHLSFAGAWAGATLLLLMFLVLARARGVGLAGRPLLRSFSAPAAYCLAVVSATGIALAARQVASIDAAITSAYGQILIVKVLAVLTAGLLGLRTAIRLRGSRSVGLASLSRGVALESAALLVALAAAGALSVGTPARGPAFVPPSPSRPSLVSAQLGDLLESAALAPNTVGQNWLRIDVNQTRRPAPAPVTAVTASLVGPDSDASATKSLIKTEIANRWELGDVNLTAVGNWEVTITAQRVGRPDTVWRTSWIVEADPSTARKPLISDRPWKSTLDDLGLVMAMLTLAAGSITVGIRRRRPVMTSEPERTTQSEERTPVRL